MLDGETDAADGRGLRLHPELGRQGSRALPRFYYRRIAVCNGRIVGRKYGFLPFSPTHLSTFYHTIVQIALRSTNSLGFKSTYL